MCDCLWKGFVKAANAFLWEASSLVRTPLHAVMVGLDVSGKTTALFRLKYNQYVNAVPTVGFNTEKVRSSGGANWMVWDVGGADHVRPLWRSYTRATDALIFVVDSSSSDDRLDEARLELMRLSKQQNTECLVLNRPKPPILILANKQDLPGARDTTNLTKFLGLSDLPDSQPWAIAPACAVTGEGMDEAMDTLRKMVGTSRQSKIIHV